MLLRRRTSAEARRRADRRAPGVVPSRTPRTEPYRRRAARRQRGVSWPTYARRAACRAGCQRAGRCSSAQAPAAASGGETLARLDRIQDPAAVQERVGGLERVGVALDHVALDVLELPVEFARKLRPSRPRHDLGGRATVQGYVSVIEPVRAVDRPRRVAPAIAERVGRWSPRRASASRTYQASHSTPRSRAIAAWAASILSAVAPSGLRARMT